LGGILAALLKKQLRSFRLTGAETLPKAVKEVVVFLKIIQDWEVIRAGLPGNAAWKGFLETRFGKASWKRGLERLPGNTVWKGFLETRFGKASWKRGLERLPGNAVWKGFLETRLF
jgi:hypothetical protein